MPDTYPPPKTDRQKRSSIIPKLFDGTRERVSGFFGLANKAEDEPVKNKQAVLMDHFRLSGHKIVSPQQLGDIMMGRNMDIDTLSKLEKDAKENYPEAVVYFREKIEAIEQN